MESYGSAGAIAEEVFGAVKTVAAFEGQNKEHERYRKHLIDAEKNNIKRSIFTASAAGVMWFNIYASIALAFWYGVKLILEERHLLEGEIIYTTSVMIAVIMSIHKRKFVNFYYFAGILCHVIVQLEFWTMFTLL